MDTCCRCAHCPGVGGDSGCGCGATRVGRCDHWPRRDDDSGTTDCRRRTGSGLALDERAGPGSGCGYTATGHASNQVDRAAPTARRGGWTIARRFGRLVMRPSQSPVGMSVRNHLAGGLTVNPTTRRRRVDVPVWSTTATLVTDSGAIPLALAEFHDVLSGIERACNRFNPDSEINRAVRNAGVEVAVSPMLNSVLADALRVAAATGYLVDPTVAAAVIALGYDRDIRLIWAAADGSGSAVRDVTGARSPAPGAWRLRHDARRGRLLIPAGVGVDLGATAKAFAADRAATRIGRLTGCGVLVSIGGDVAVAGQAPRGGWRIAVGDHHRTAESSPLATVAIASGGLATSSITARRWQTSTGERHHLIDPRTGDNPRAVWRTVSVAAGSCVDANGAATAAIVLGEKAQAWLIERSLPSLLVPIEGPATVVAGWPAQSGATAP